MPNLQEQLKLEGIHQPDFIGDGAYIGHTFYGTLILFTTNGIDIQNKIELELFMLDTIQRYIKRLEIQP